MVEAHSTSSAALCLHPLRNSWLEIYRFLLALSLKAAC
ncbi:hypothetical protein [Sideroxydans sp. CL21]|nr:hypothetical protein [Sideroxydans sp. CL21]